MLFIANACGGGGGSTGGGQSTFTVSGTVTGLEAGKQVTLLNNSGNPTAVSTNSNFLFSTPIAYNGSYVVSVGTQPNGQTCTVSNGSGSSVVSNSTNTVVLCQKTAPVANAGADQTVKIDVSVVLNGDGSSDVNNYPLAALWQFSSKPVGSAASIISTSQLSAKFTPDLVGTYVASLIVLNDKAQSSPSFVTITATPPVCQNISSGLSDKISLDNEKTNANLYAGRKVFVESLGQSIQYTLYSSSGSVIKRDIASTVNVANQYDQSVSVTSNCGFIVSWVSSDRAPGDFGGVYFQVFDAGGNKVGAETKVATQTYGGSRAAVGLLPNGKYLITWGSNNTLTDQTSYSGFQNVIGRYLKSDFTFDGDTFTLALKVPYYPVGTYISVIGTSIKVFWFDALSNLITVQL